ncbi:hypothetical protein LSH36_6g08000 [Paralvinella palmiformis]|uniref:Uncharacterized protein n=1 Tax=Paralvinella palmiformis TaxID=53620 RepID=A0AAD9KEP4_9ANNE|nr:hypothetical protein LSH36_6g08000 [Paralvinella palmiformis]
MFGSNDTFDMGTLNIGGKVNNMGKVNIMGEVNIMGKVNIMGEVNIMGKVNIMPKVNIIGKVNIMREFSVLAQRPWISPASLRLVQCVGSTSRGQSGISGLVQCAGSTSLDQSGIPETGSVGWLNVPGSVRHLSDWFSGLAQRPWISPASLRLVQWAGSTSLDYI